MALMLFTGGIIFGLAVIADPSTTIHYAAQAVKYIGLSYIVAKAVQSMNKTYAEIVTYTGWCMAGSSLIGVVRIAMESIEEVGAFFQGIANFFDKITFWN